MLDVFTADLRRRHDGDELMDDPGSDREQLHRTLQQFALLNRWFARYRTLLSRWVLADMLQAPQRQYHLLDLGAGACDIPRWLLQQAHRHGLQLRVTALDADERVLRWTREHVLPIAGLTLVQQDVRDLSAYDHADYVFANHLLHHLHDDDLLALFDQVAALQPRAAVLSDLQRTRTAYLGYTLFAGLFLRRSFAYFDGRQSIRRGFTPGELEAAIGRSALRDRARVVTCFPGRIAVVVG